MCPLVVPMYISLCPITDIDDAQLRFYGCPRSRMQCTRAKRPYTISIQKNRYAVRSGFEIFTIFLGVSVLVA